MTASPYIEHTALGDYVVGYMNRLKLPSGKGAGAALTLRPWQERIIRDIFSRVHGKTGERQYREAFVAMPKKNGKTGMIAASVVYLTCGQEIIGGEVYSGASTREQASLIFRAAAYMVESDPHLDRVCTVNYSKKRIIHNPTRTFYQALSADADYGDGINPTALVYDELHRAPNGDLYDLFKNSMGAQPEGVLLNITTAGHDKATICGAVWDYAVKVRDGVVDDPSFYPCIFAAKDEDDWKDEAVWKRANPALGDFLSLDEMRRNCARAIAQPSLQAAFKRYRLNIWSESDDAWLPISRWDSGKIEAPDDLLGKRCILGVDLSATGDITAIVQYFPELNLCVEFYFCPKENLTDRQESTGVPYVEWAAQGFITATPGNVVDYGVVEAKVEQLCTDFNVEAVMIDRWNSTGTMTRLMEKGIKVVQFGQGYSSMNAPSKEVEMMVMGEKLRHLGNPVTRWMVSNTIVESDPAGNIKPSKRKAKGKIDGVVALVMAVGGSLTPGTGPGAFEAEGSYVL